MKSFFHSICCFQLLFFQCVSGLLILLGFLSIFLNKAQHGKPHFTSWHSLGGMFTCVLVVKILIGGLLSKYPRPVKSLFTVSAIRRIHALFAGVVFSLAGFTIALGLNSSWALSVMPFPLPYVLMTAMPVHSFIVLKQVYDNRLKAIFRS